MGAARPESAPPARPVRAWSEAHAIGGAAAERAQATGAPHPASGLRDPQATALATRTRSEDRPVAAVQTAADIARRREAPLPNGAQDEGAEIGQLLLELPRVSTQVTE